VRVSSNVLLGHADTQHYKGFNTRRILLSIRWQRGSVDITHYNRHVKLAGCKLHVSHLNFLGSLHNTSRQTKKLA